MGPGQGAQHLTGHVDGVGHRHAALALQVSAQVFAAEQLHHQERPTVVRRARVEDVDDVRALDHPGGFRFALEASHGVGVFGGVAIEELQGDALADRDVGRLVHRAHAAAPDQALDPVLVSDDAAAALVVVLLLGAAHATSPAARTTAQRDGSTHGEKADFRG